MLRILNSEVDGKAALCFDTGLDPRSFARTKMSQSLIESGYAVYPDGTKKVWKATGVNEINGLMRVWGTPFIGDRLDLLLNEVTSASRQAEVLQAALQSVIFWIRAKMLLGDVNSSLNPGAVFISRTNDNGPSFPKGSVFFAPQNLSHRCLFVEGAEQDHFNCPDLFGMDASAFCAGAMLYTILAQTRPFSDGVNLYQDMREGVFLPVELAAPGLDEKLCELINTALLLPVENKKTFISGTDILGELLKILMSGGNAIAAVTSLFRQVPEEEKIQRVKEKKRYLLKQDIYVKTRRFAVRNKPALIGTSLAALFIIFVTVTMTTGNITRPTTGGMAPDTVVLAYYDAFSSLNHTFMEACIYRADRSDINAAANYFAVSRVRQAHELRPGTGVIPARVWIDSGGELPAPDVFGVTDLTIQHIGGSEYDAEIFYRANYNLWFPNELTASNRSDDLTLKRIRGNWRITEIKRTWH
jgi:hypothetical protein